MSEITHEMTLADSLNQSCDYVSKALSNMRLLASSLQAYDDELNNFTGPLMSERANPVEADFIELGRQYLSRLRLSDLSYESVRTHAAAVNKLSELVSSHRGEHIGVEAKAGTPITVLGYVARLGSIATTGNVSSIIGRLDYITNVSDMRLNTKRSLKWSTIGYQVQTIDPYTQLRQVNFTTV